MPVLVPCPPRARSSSATRRNNTTHSKRKQPPAHTSTYSATLEETSTNNKATSNTHTHAHLQPELPTTRNVRRKSPTKTSDSSHTLNASSPALNSLSLRNDRLGTLVQNLVSAFTSSPSWESFVNEFRGPSYLSTELDDIDHPAAALLRRWREEGVPVLTSSDPWSLDQKDACIERGCHKSAKDHSVFLREELAEFVESKFWAVLPYPLVRELELMLSPAAVKEERERKPRLLCDHSWPWSGWTSVNDSTLAHAPPEAMQFGRTLTRLLTDIRHSNPKFGPVRTAKYDIKDGFYRLFLRARECLRLSLVLPKYEGETQLVAIPLACTMGWVQSPPTFCTMSETVCDITNKAIRESKATAIPPHRLETAAATEDDLSFSPEPRAREPEDSTANKALQAVIKGQGLPVEEDLPAPPSNRSYNRPLATTDVFVDDFIQLAQGGPNRMRGIRRMLLPAVDQVLATPQSTDTERNEAISLKKLLKGDGSWSTRKIVLGWLIDTIRQTIELPPHRKITLASIFADLSNRERISHKTYQSYLGQLRFVAVAIPGSAGLFSALQLALTRSKGNRIRITHSLRQHITAFASLAASLCHRPTHLAEIIPQTPSFLGTTDAAKPGMGGVYYDHTGQGYVWRAPFPDSVQRRLVSTDNPTGTITNSDLEQAGMLAQLSLIAAQHSLPYATISTGCDNTPAVSRAQKGAVSSDGPAAHLCNYACQHQRLHRYCHHAYYIPGPANVMADDASRLQHLTDTDFLLHFNQEYPQPQPWILLHLPLQVVSRLISALHCQSPLLPTHPNASKPTARSSASGQSSAPPMGKPLPSILSTLKNASATSSSLDNATAPPARRTTLSALVQYGMPYKPWGRGFPTWDTRIHVSSREEPSCIPYSMISSKPCPKRTTQPLDPTQSTPPSSVHSLPCSTLTMKSTAHSTAMSSTSSLLLSSSC